MRVFLDSNVWVAGLSTRGLCTDLIRLLLRRHGHGHVALLVSKDVRDETLRILRDKLGASENELWSVRDAMAWAECVSPADWQPPSGFPDPEDVAIVGAAIAADADLFVTGDRALIEMDSIQGLALVPPRTAYERLRQATGVRS